MCMKSYTGKYIRARDHCHITGEYRGSAYQTCNVSFPLINQHFLESLK